MSSILDNSKMNLYIKNKQGDFVSLGEALACILTLKNGKKFSFGKVEDVFDIEITKEDKALLKEMRIGR